MTQFAYPPSQGSPDKKPGTEKLGTEQPQLRRWVVRLPLRTVAGFVMITVLVSLSCWRLGLWQYHRYTANKQANQAMEHQLSLPEVPLEQILSSHLSATQGHQLPADAQWRPVLIHGHFDPEKLILWRNRTHNRQSGVHVVVPFRTGSGQVILVDCGWVSRHQVPASIPSGQVRVTGWLRHDQPVKHTQQVGWAPAEHNLSSVAPAGASLPAPSFTHLNSALLGQHLQLDLLPGFVQLRQLSPQPPEFSLTSTQGPAMRGTVLHLSYAWQWWLFAVLTPVGFFLLARRTTTDTS